MGARVYGRRRAMALAVALLFAAGPLCAHALVDINTADATTLEGLTGIGPSKAAAIIEYRTQHGPFAAIADIQQVSGIGPSTYAGIERSITVGNGASTSTGGDTTPASDTSDTDTTASDTASATTSDAPAKAVSSYVPPPAPALFADAGGDRTVIVGADTEFSAVAYDRGQQLVEDNVRFSWNFGDGATAEGSAVLHHFAYPGRYAVVLSIAHNIDAATDEIIVTAEPAKLSFAALPDGSVAIGNEAGRDLDLSGWLIRQFDERFALPEHSIVLAGQDLRIPPATLHFYAGASAELEYPNGVKVLAAGAQTPAATPPTTSAVRTVQASAPASAAPAPVVHRAAARAPAAAAQPSASPAAAPSASPDAGAPEASSSSQLAAAAASTRTSWPWWVAAAALALAAGAALAAARHAAKSEWDIIEETAE